MSPARFVARHRGRCPACDDPITPGQPCTWQDGAVVHHPCPDDGPAPRDRPVCQSCYLTSCDCEDRP